MKYAFSGHLWQARPFSCVLDEQHFWAAIRYVERNPVRAEMVGCAEDAFGSSKAGTKTETIFFSDEPDSMDNRQGTPLNFAMRSPSAEFVVCPGMQTGGRSNS